MRPYPNNSPQAIARLLAMFMITDGNMDPRELDLLENVNVYDLIGLPRKQFAQVLADYCDDISDEAEQDGTIHLLDTDRIEFMLGEVTDRNKRILTCVLAMDISKSDGTISDPEIVLLRHMMKEWNISLEDLERQFVR
ncbi:TerB family tellurite resistance protein [Aquitalea palustris]|uniref:TerB family tellurite resistance protein n=1 Tax=Aquitalea palustris TaxID=2480983 RepID=A0A454JHG5_9NEIS|nr:TerB family tellurite resistance protein [Aquitalea palustris]RMC96372.1 TerB family tellurite resistance protein [Aquitalea palustris]